MVKWSSLIQLTSHSLMAIGKTSKFQFDNGSWQLETCNNGLSQTDSHFNHSHAGRPAILFGICPEVSMAVEGCIKFPHWWYVCEWENWKYLSFCGKMIAFSPAVKIPCRSMCPLQELQKGRNITLRCNNILFSKICEPKTFPSFYFVSSFPLFLIK